MSKYKLFLQDSINDCGPACLASILRYHGRYVTPIDLVKDMELSRGGALNHEIIHMAGQHGLLSKVIQLPIEMFDRLDEPSMAYVSTEDGNGKHLVVIFKVNGKNILVGDPGKGLRRMTIDDFSERYLGLMLIFQKSDLFKPEKISEPYLYRFLRFVAEYRIGILKTLLLGLATSSGAFGLIYLSKLYVDRVLPSNDMSWVWAFVGAYLGAKILLILLKAVNEMFAVHLKTGITEILSNRFLNRSLDLEKRHIDAREAGDFLWQFSQIEKLTTGISSYFSNFVLVVFGMVVKATFLIWLYDVGLVLIILAIVALNASVGFLFSRLTSEHTNRRGMLYSQINTALLNALGDIRVVRMFGAQNWVRDIYQIHLKEALQSLKTLTRLNVFGKSSAEMLSIFSEAAIFLIVGMRIFSGDYTIGDLLVFLSMAQMLTSDSLRFPELVLEFETQLRSFARLQVVNEQSLERQDGHYDEADSMEVEFRNVSFGYVRGFPVLDNVSFLIPANKTTAIVGHSGSGKSTIMNLIMGFYEPWSGAIFINGRDLRELKLDRYRKDVSAVFQETPIFNKTLMSNVTFGNPEVDAGKVKYMAELLGVDEFIKRLPEDYDQMIHMGYLSGGQSQRIGILRALCQDFKLLLLDEATSHLDSLTEERIVNGVEAVAGDKTRMVIAHRLSTVMEADQIIVLEKGEIVEVGKHQDLIENEGPYLQLIQRQYEVNLTPSLPTAT